MKLPSQDLFKPERRLLITLNGWSCLSSEALTDELDLRLCWKGDHSLTERQLCEPLLTARACMRMVALADLQP